MYSHPKGTFATLIPVVADLIFGLDPTGLGEAGRLAVRDGCTGRGRNPGDSQRAGIEARLVISPAVPNRRRAGYTVLLRNVNTPSLLGQQRLGHRIPMRGTGLEHRQQQTVQKRQTSGHIHVEQCAAATVRQHHSRGASSSRAAPVTANSPQRTSVRVATDQRARADVAMVDGLVQTVVREGVCGGDRWRLAPVSGLPSRVG